MRYKFPKHVILQINCRASCCEKKQNFCHPIKLNDIKDSTDSRLQSLIEGVVQTRNMPLRCRKNRYLKKISCPTCENIYNTTFTSKMFRGHQNGINRLCFLFAMRIIECPLIKKVLHQHISIYFNRYP